MISGKMKLIQKVATVVDKEQRMNRGTDGQMDEPYHILIQLADLSSRAYKYAQLTPLMTAFQ